MEDILDEKNSRHKRHELQLSSEEDESDISVEENEEEEIDEEEQQSNKKRKFDTSQDDKLIEEFRDYLLKKQPPFSDSTILKHISTIAKVMKRKKFYQITSLKDIYNNLDIILKHELTETKDNTAIKYFHSFLSQSIDSSITISFTVNNVSLKKAKYIMDALQKY